MKRCSTALILAGALLPFYGVSAQDSSESLPYDDASVEEVRGMVSIGECDRALEVISGWDKASRKNPDVLALEGNCRLHQGRESSGQSDSIAYERISLARGREMLTGDQKERFALKRVTYDPDAVKAASALFRKALDLEPTRVDLIVGNIAMLADVGRLDDALSLLSKSADKLPGPDALRPIARDLKARGDFDGAMRFAKRLDEVLPSAYTATDLAQLYLDSHQARPAIAEFEKAMGRGAAPEIERQFLRLRLFARGYGDLLRELVESAPEDTRHRLWLAMAQDRLRPGSSKKLLEQVKQELLALPQRDPAAELVVDHYIKIAASSAPPTPVMRLRASRNFLDKGISLPALIEADHAMADSNGVEAAMLLVEIYRRIGLFDLGVEVIDDALARWDSIPESERSYDESELHEQRGLLLIGTQRFADAASALDAAKRLGAPVQYEKAVADLWAGREKDAIKQLKAVSSAGGQNSDAARSKLEQLGVSVE